MSEESLLPRIQTDMTAAMKSRDLETLSTLRMLKAALMEAKTKKPKDSELSRDEEIEVLQRYVKKRRETIEELSRIGRTETLAREEQEIVTTQRYLPAAASEEEIRTLVAEAIAVSGAAGPRDLGKVIGLVMPKVKGRAEGGAVSRIVKQALGG
jgi:uncharacterized protein YqeY